MLNQKQAMMLVEKEYPGTRAEVCVNYRELYLVRVKHADPDEANYDPFFSVDPSTGSVKEFSILTDGNPIEISKLFNTSEIA